MTVRQKQLMLCWFGFLEPQDVDGVLGPYTEAAIRKMQEYLNLTADGIWGDQTDTTVREYIFSGADLPVEPGKTGTFWDHIRYWSREEFRCQCGGKYCNGFPAEPDRTLVELVDDIRHELGAVAHRSSGLRCEIHNRNEGGVWNSRHLSGKALDFFVEGVSGQRLLETLQKDPRCAYAYIISGQYVHVDVE
ncbi:MAG: peptidoglycan-binding protein [Oscillospiraceae bacterium]|nr:peptidoglycan-binding protein [Oscillospiraceae bacterium]